MTLSNIYFYGGILCIFVVCAMVMFLLSRTTPTVPPELGLRGMQRHRARKENRSFRRFESLIRYVGGIFSELPLRSRRLKTESRLAQAGHFMGLSADELYAISFLSGIAGTIFVGLCATILSFPLIFSPIFGAFIAYLPIFRVGSEIDSRSVDIGRGLPNTVETISLCMSAGLDFPGSLRKIVNNRASDTALYDELQNILRELDLGHPRSRALRAFANRVPSDNINDLVSAIIQSEDKGTPLKQVLSIQADMLRMQRSIKAEEAAARSTVLMIIPMMLLLACTMLMIAAPLLVQVAAWGSDL